MNEEIIKNLLKKQIHTNPVDIIEFDKRKLLKMLHDMVLIRKVENQLAKEKKAGNIKGPVHLGVGQEAIAVGISSNLTLDDRVFGNHRSHSHILALNNDPYRLFAEILGKKTGLCHGMGGSMHLLDKKNGFYGSVPIVAGTVPISLGSALSSKLKKDKKITISYLGDGAIEEGVVHESMNFAKIHSLPLIFVIENNLMASHMHIDERQPLKSLCRFAEANCITSAVVDGNDITSVSKISNQFIEEARLGKGPFFLEAITYRWYGHVDWREDIDVGLNRSKEDIKNWKIKDPVERLKISMISEKIMTSDEFYNLEAHVDQTIENEWKKAMSDPYPKKNDMLEYVYANE